jgi:large subunit ribosomal protein L13
MENCPGQAKLKDLVMSKPIFSRIPVGSTETDRKIPVGRKESEMKSFIAKPHEVERKWYIIDAEGKTLGRMASEAAAILRGKRKVTYTPHVDCGDYVIIINAEKVAVTGKKRKEKIYKRHTGYPGGLKEVTFEQVMEKHPTEVVRHAVKGMMPTGKLGRQMYKKLKVYAGPDHDHAAQKPEVLDI